MGFDGKTEIETPLIHKKRFNALCHLLAEPEGYTHISRAVIGSSKSADCKKKLTIFHQSLSKRNIKKEAVVFMVVFALSRHTAQARVGNCAKPSWSSGEI